VGSMKIFYCDEFVLPLPPEHRFPMEKYRLLRERLLTGGVVGPGCLDVPPPATDKELGSAHDPRYLERVIRGELDRDEIRRIGFPWSPELVERSRRSVGGTIAAARAALREGAGANLAGGTHHAFQDRGEGFCVFNDVAVAVRVLQGEGRIQRAGVLDLDVHQGNGTAALFRQDPSVFTVSVHGAGNFPFRKEESDLDIPLPDGAGDDPFLSAVERGLRTLLEQGQPDMIFYLAGADPFEDDRLGRLAVTRVGLEERDRLVVEAARSEGLPVAVVMAGGYARRVEDTVEIHAHSIERVATLADGTRRSGPLPVPIPDWIT
jgi:acetoin utilization deacetylase AcuC-like enzyme